MPLKNLAKLNELNYGWVVVVILLFIDSMVSGVAFTLGLMLPSISRDLNISLQQAGWLGAMNWEVSAILTIPATYYLARFSPKKLILGACLAEAVLMVAHSLAPNYWLLLASRIFFMAAGLLRFTAGPMLVQQWFPKSQVARVNTIYIVGSGIAAGTVVFFMGDLIESVHGWRTVFLIFGAVSALLFLVWWRLGRERVNPEIELEVRQPIALKSLVKNKTLWLLGLGITGDMMCFGAMETLWPQHITSLGILSLSDASYCEGLAYYGFTIGSLLGGIITIRLGRRKPVLWISGLLLPFVTLGILYSQSFSLLAVLWFLWGAAELYFPVMMTIPYELPQIKPQEVAVASAFVMSVYTGGSGLGPLLGGYLAGALGSLERALLVICLFPVLLLITGLLIKETGPGARSKTVSDQ